MYDLAGRDSLNLWGLFHSSMEAPATVLYTTGTNSSGAKLDLLEATATRVKVRQESFYQRVLPATAILPGVKGIGDYSVYGQRVALRWNRRVTAAVPDQDDHALELTAHREAAGVLNPMGLYSQGGPVFPLPQVTTSCWRRGRWRYSRRAHRLPRDPVHRLAGRGQPDRIADRRVLRWRDTTDDQVLAAGLDEKWNFLVYYKAPNFLDNTDSAVTTRSADYRTALRGVRSTGARVTSGRTRRTLRRGDWFNESEAAYPLDLHPVTGLTSTSTARRPRATRRSSRSGSGARSSRRPR